MSEAELLPPPSGTAQHRYETGRAFPCELGNTPPKLRENDESLMKSLKQGNTSFIIKGRGSSVVEQPIRNRQVVGSTPTLGSTVFGVHSTNRVN